MQQKTKNSLSLHHHAAVGLVFNQEQQILISKRPAHKLKGGFWEFPGGKIEENEDPEKALIRELQEEVGITATKIKKLTALHHDYLTHTVDLEIFVITEFMGAAEALEGQEIQWITLDEFSNFRFLEANAEIIELLKKF